jgi:hypothetical protein
VNILAGFVKVLYFFGMAAGLLLVLALIGAVYQHAKLTTMTAVGDGLVDCAKWVVFLSGKLLALL